MAGSGYFKIVSKARDDTNGAYLAIAAWDLADENRVWVENEAYDNALQLWESAQRAMGTALPSSTKRGGFASAATGTEMAKGFRLPASRG